MEKELKVREDLNNIVRDIKFGLVKTRFNEKKVCSVTMFNGDVVDFADTEGLYDMILTHQKLGLQCVKDKKLVEEIQKSPTEEDRNPLYVCVLVTLHDGSEFRLFPSKRADKVRIEAYYTAYKNANSKKSS